MARMYFAFLRYTKYFKKNMFFSQCFNNVSFQKRIKKAFNRAKELEQSKK
jgi:hypothetical protein